jgi:hypothetical protein
MRDRDVDSGEGLCTLRRHEQRLERRKKTASNRVGASGLALTTHRARNRCAPRDGQRLPEGGRHRVRQPRAWGRRPPAKPANGGITGSTAESSARNGNPNPKNLPEEGNSKSQTAKPANEVITGFGVEFSGVAAKPHSPTASVCEPFREAIALGLSRGRNAMAIWRHDGYSGRDTAERTRVRRRVVSSRRSNLCGRADAAKPRRTWDVSAARVLRPGAMLH